MKLWETGENYVLRKFHVQKFKVEV